MATQTAQDLATLDTLIIERHNASHPEKLAPDGWTDDWIFRVLLNPRRVRPSRQEAQALANWTRAHEEKETGCR
jgi:hypothetical protein